jgi:hypothetical protein
MQYLIHLVETKQNYRNVHFFRNEMITLQFHIQNHMYPLHCACHIDTQVILILKDLPKQDTSRSASSKKIKQICIYGH